MTMSIEKLKREHRNLRAVLALSEAELTRLDQARPAESTRLMQTLDYLRHYFDQVHHPHEDLIFDYVDAKRCESHDAVMSHAAGHEAIYQLGHILDQWLEQPSAALPADFKPVCRRYLQLQRESLDAEEQDAFPLAERCLTKRDWRRIAENQRAADAFAATERVALRYGAWRQLLADACEA